MSIYAIYMIFFGLSTFVGVPLLSSFQVTQIKGSDYADWVAGLPITMGATVLIFIVVSLITYFIMKPLRKAIKDAETRELTQEEKSQASRLFLLWRDILVETVLRLL